MLACLSKELGVCMNLIQIPRPPDMWPQMVADTTDVHDPMAILGIWDHHVGNNRGRNTTPRTESTNTLRGRLGVVAFLVVSGSMIASWVSEG